MADMLVRLYALPDAQPFIRDLARSRVTIREPHVDEKSIVIDWVRAQFTDGWADECARAFAVAPPTCRVAFAPEGIVGFACHDCTRRNFFGPTGVAELARGRGIGRALLLACLHAMRDDGYAYAIIGGVGPAEFYMATVNATMIAGSTPGIYVATAAHASAANGIATRMLAALPKLASADIARSLDFYRRLGFTCIAVDPDLGIATRDAVSLHFWRCTDPAVARVTGCRVEVSGITTLFSECVALGVVHPAGSLVLKPWGYREFSMLDADGNLVTFAEREN